MSRKDEKEYQERVIKSAVDRVRRVIQNSYNNGALASEALKAGAEETVGIVRSYPKIESTINYFCKFESDRLAEAMQATDQRNAPKLTFEQKWRAERQKAAVAKKVLDAQH